MCCCSVSPLYLVYKSIGYCAQRSATIVLDIKVTETVRTYICVCGYVRNIVNMVASSTVVLG